MECSRGYSNPRNAGDKRYVSDGYGRRPGAIGPAGDVDRYDKDFPPEWDAVPSRPDGDRDYGSRSYKDAKDIRIISRTSGEGHRTESREVETTGWSGVEIREVPDYRNEAWDYRGSSGRGSRLGDRVVAREDETRLSGHRVPGFLV
jgi:hypothetical protein